MCGLLLLISACAEEATAFSGGHRQGRILEKTELDDGGSAFIAVGLRESEGGAADTIVLPAPTGPVAQPFPTPPGWWIPVPFTPVSIYRLDQNGRLLHGHGERFRILRGELDGTVTREILLDADPTPVTEEDLREWEEGVAVQRYRAMIGEELDLSLIPDTKPYFDDVYPGWDSRPPRGCRP